MSLVDIKSHDLLKELVQGLVTVCDNEGPLVREVVVDVADDLNCYISFTSTWMWENVM